MKSEYLITFDANDRICTSAEKFKNCLAAHASISVVKNDTLGFDGSEFPFRVEEGKLGDGARYYNLTIENTEPGERNGFTTLLDEVLKIFARMSGRNIITLHDGTGEDYCQRSYPIIYKTETLMRKFVTMFAMSSLVDDDSVASADNPFGYATRTADPRDRLEILRDASFLHLSDFLFTKYVSAKTVRFTDSLKKKTDDELISVADLKHRAPSTRWETHFANQTNCESEYLRAKCERVYQYSVKIARYKGMSKHEFEDLALISAEICEKLHIAMRTIADTNPSAAHRGEHFDT